MLSGLAGHQRIQTLNFINKGRTIKLNYKTLMEEHKEHEHEHDHEGETKVCVMCGHAHKKEDGTCDCGCSK